MIQINNKKKDVTQQIKEGEGLPPNISYAGNSPSVRVQPPSATVTAVTAPGGEINTYAANGVDTGGGNGTDTLANAIQGAIVSYEDYVKGIAQNAQLGFQNAYANGQVQLQYSANVDGGGGEVADNTDIPQNAPVENTVEEPVTVQSTQVESKVEEYGEETGESEPDTPTYTRSDGSPAFVWDEATGNWILKPEPIKDEIEEYYEGAEERADGVRRESYEANAAARESAEKNAAIARERAIVDARSDAELREMSYGANAEALESRGLSASGYGDYIGTQSYAQMRGETQYATAQAEYAKRIAAEQEASANNAADIKYSDYVDAAEEKLATYREQKDAAHLTTVDTFLKQAELITSEEELEALITRAYGADLTQSEIENIRNIANTAIIKYGEQEQAAADAKMYQDYLNILDAIAKGSSWDVIEDMMSRAGIDETSMDYYNTIKSEYDTYTANQWVEIKSGARTGKYSAEDIVDWAKANGYVNEDGSLNAEAQAAVDEATMWSRYNLFMTDITTNGANANIDNIIKAESHGLITPEMYDKLMAAYNIVAPGNHDSDKGTDPEKTSALAEFRMTIRGSEMNPNEALDYALSLGLTEEEFRSEYSKVITENVGEKMFEELSAEEAKDVYDGLINDPYVGDEVKDKVREYYANYEGKASIIAQNVSIDKAPNNYREKGNFVIRLPDSEDPLISYQVELGKRASDTTSDRLSSTYKNEKGGTPTHGALIVEQGRLFIYFEGKTDAGWVMVQRRAANGYAQSFKDLCAALGITYYSERGEEI